MKNLEHTLLVKIPNYVVILSIITIFSVILKESGYIREEYQMSLSAILLTIFVPFFVFVVIIPFLFEKNKIRKRRLELSEINNILPNNCYIKKIDNKIIILPLPFLTNHEKMEIMAKHDEELKNMPYIFYSSINKKHYENKISLKKETYLKYQNKVSVGTYVEENGNIIFENMNIRSLDEDIYEYN